MDKLNNITSFSDFKKLYEGIGDEFSNTVGFTESLIGRATFGLINMVKFGVNKVLLEFYGRRLEDEFFAGLLRYCKKANIDLKDPKTVPPDTNVNVDTGEEENDMVKIAEEILMIRFDDPTYDADLTEISKLINSGLITVGAVTGSKEIDDFKMLDTKLIPLVKAIDDSFSVCNGLITSSTLPSAATVSNINKIISNIEEVKKLTLTSTPTPIQPEYKLSDAEVKVISGLTSTSVTDPAIIDPIKKVLIYENSNYSKYRMITEKVGSGSGTKISFILGDELSTEGVDKFLRDQGINNVEEINFTQLAKVFNDSMRKNATGSVNKDGIIRIQQGMLPKIYHKTPTPKGMGLHPGKGGGIDTSAPTALFLPWQKKVKDVQGQFQNFMNTAELDPFKLDVGSYSGKDDPDKSKLNAEGEKSNEIQRLSILEKDKNMNKFKIEIPKTIKSLYMLRIFSEIDKKFYGPIFRLESTKAGSLNVYKYMGSLNVDVINKDIIDTKKYSDDLKKYETIFPNSGNGLPPTFLQNLINGSKSKVSGMDLTGVYFIFSKSISSLSSGETNKNPVQIFLLYTRGTTITTPPPSGDFEIWSVSENSVPGKVTDLTNLKNVQSYKKISIGATLNIENTPFKDKDEFKYPIENLGGSSGSFDLMGFNGVTWKK